MPEPGARAARGYTLIELLVALSVMAVAMAWLAPALERWWLGLKVTAASNHFVGMLETSRYRSLVLREAVTICASNDGRHCSRDEGRALVVFRDDNRNGEVEEGEPVLLHDNFAGGEEFRLAWRSFQGTEWLRWAAGRTDSMNGTFTVCNRQRRDEWLRQVVVSRAGRTRVVVPLRAGASALRAARRACGWG